MELGKRFADDAGVTDQVGWDDESVELLLTQLIEADDGILLVGEKSMLGGLIYAHPFNRNCRVFQELFWRSEGFEGLKLLAEAERLATAKGATQSLMLDVIAMPGAARIYERRGYKLTERTFTKEL
jgi:GNAT superfamily N-acetyltransferase